ncbi:MAG: hypothetical protein LBT40_15435, partial [Deltaproteobacteria bacterium]|nr:hypothetical protein [Deltaproteobacteria bacterium]
KCMIPAMPLPPCKRTPLRQPVIRHLTSRRLSACGDTVSGNLSRPGRTVSSSQAGSRLIIRPDVN